MGFTSDCQDMKVGAEQLVSDDDFADEFVCNICLVHVVGCGPKLTKCSHLFCGDCLHQWFMQHPGNQTWAQRAKSGGCVPCPVCKTALNKDTDVFPVEEHGDGDSAILWQMIQGLQVKCDGRQCADGCCSWIGKLGNFQQHLQSGTCGMHWVVKEATLPEEAPTEVFVLDAPVKEVPSSPTTCSLCSPENSSVEEWSIGSVGEVSEDEPDCLDVAFAGSAEAGAADEASGFAEPGAADEASGHDLTSLIRALIDIKAEDTEIALQPSLNTAFAPVVERMQDQVIEVDATGTCQPATGAALTPANCPEVVEHLQDQVAAAKPTTNPQGSKPNKPKKSKSKAKKSSGIEDAEQATDAQKRVQVAYQWQMQQWQAAQYQMAYAQRYQMAMHAMQTQQAAQYQSQRVGYTR
jgi:hypothetical protein